MSGNVVAVIPARGGSKGIPRKNVRALGDRPLVAHTIAKSKDAQLVDSVVLTTDSREIAQVGRKYGADEVIERPVELATDEVPLAPVMEHAYDALDGAFEYVLCLQPTVPLLSTDAIDRGIRIGFDAHSDSVVFVRDSTHQYWAVEDDSYTPVPDERKNRQYMDKIYEEIGVFLSHNSLIRDGRRVGDDPAFHEVPARQGIDIDTYADWLLAENYLRRKRVVYRVIGNGQAGTGHVYRGITIADHIFEHDVEFATVEGNDLAIENLDESNYDYRTFDSEDSFVEYVRSSSPDVVVNDVLDTSAEYVRALTDCGCRVVNFEDLGDGTEHADAVVNALYEYSDPPKNHYFGFKYFCLRNEFRYATPHEAIPDVERIMISFGGTDENNLTAKTLRALADVDIDLHLDVVIGLGYAQEETLRPIIEGYPAQIDVKISQNVNSMAEHMEQADLLITSNGRTLYEASSMNLPTISIAQNHREQKHPYAHVSRGILALGQADYVTEGNIRTAVEDCITDSDRREAMRAALEDTDIANGIDRIKNIIFEKDHEN
ncbi:CMP-N-acetylneuraminic acid synthetase [Halovenus aranensis]|uniref:CMP-N-acetylneuraminic acid synthetase n=1 Tax=Halovenus aranensis TaxID=890420 RepID=A0A1G8YXU6_9EURY|nr:glycosyltransferase [Halovenus aranensis]SDK06790.1 CMP-N-acetylneuraminic acid synthetase [Halovenus aranensis]